MARREFPSKVNAKAPSRRPLPGGRNSDWQHKRGVGWVRREEA
jgi:hypothetical protein